MRKQILCFLFLLTSIHLLQAKDASFYAANSVLSNGSWYKIRVSSDGIYKLTYDALKNMGISDPSHVQIRGYGGWILDEDFSKLYHDDLPQIAVWMNKGSDGIFNSGDYLLFYGRGPQKVVKQSNEFRHINNPYSNYGYYFITQGSEEPLQMQTNTSLAVTDSTVTTYRDYLIHEKDETNLLESGREFYGESFFGNTSQNITMNIPGIVNWEGYRLNFILKPTSTVNLSLTLNDRPLFSKNIVANTEYYSAGTVVSNYIDKISEVAENNVFTIRLSASGVKNSYLNYLKVYFKRKLQPYGPVTFFRNEVSTQSHKYVIANASPEMLVFDVTENIFPTVQQTSYENNTLSFGSLDTSQREYALVDLSKSIPSPENLGKIRNQNLHSLKKADMVIIVSPTYKDYAQQLANAHFENSGITSLIVNPNDIYNEFSSGNPDATAYRRFMKMFYDRGRNESDRPKYLLLFGNGTYNNKFIHSNLSEAEQKTYLLTYESEDSSDERTSYVTDDYFGFLQDEKTLSIGAEKLCLGIGRFPIRTSEDARVLVNKSIAYMKDTNPGIWKNSLCFLADDAVAGDKYAPSVEILHEKQTDKYTEYIQSKYPNFIINKIYMDSYERTVQANGNRYFTVQEDLLRKINSGQLILNYVGHGSTRDWAHEYVITYPDIKALSNKHLPLWITATCDFSRFDAANPSAGEAALVNPKGGAIALFSTVRVVYISNNDIMGTNIYKNIFERDSDGKALRFGDIIRKSKLSFSYPDDNKLRFLLLGDPALRLSYPDDKYNVKIKKIDGDSVPPSGINITALSNVKIEGEIVDKNGKLVDDFDGKVSTIVFDAQQNVRTRDNGKDGNFFDYKDYTNKLFSGILDVKNGVFNYEFAVPKDIVYSDKKGKMNFFAWEEKGRNAQGAFLNYTIKGSNTSAKLDVKGPEFTDFYLNVPEFVSGGRTNSTPLLYIGVKDESGINLSGGIGHLTQAIIDEKIYYDITPNFTFSGSSTKEGYISYSIPELSEGRHTLKVVVWDIWNNHSERSIDFIVDNTYKVNVIGFSVAPNPAKEYARFLFTSNLPQSNLNIKYDVYTMTGSLIWSHQESGSSEAMQPYAYDWNLRLSNGSRIHPGIYICRITVNMDGEQRSSKSLRLMVLRD